MCGRSSYTPRPTRLSWPTSTPHGVPPERLSRSALATLRARLLAIGTLLMLPMLAGCWGVKRDEVIISRTQPHLLARSVVVSLRVKLEDGTSVVVERELPEGSLVVFPEGRRD